MMLRIFSKIRHGLIGTSGSRAGKYLSYALGEILLVMVGILLALQVNNWNEERKDQRIEREILLEIKNDLQNTLDDLEQDLVGHESMLNSGLLVRKALVEDHNFPDSLNQHLTNAMGDTKTFPKVSGYQSLMSRGVDIISNDSLRMAITELYQLHFARLDDSAEEYRTEDIMRPFENKLMKLSSESGFYQYTRSGDSILFYYPKIISATKLMGDSEFLMNLQESIHFRTRKIRRCKTVRFNINRILNMINSELSGLS